MKNLKFQSLILPFFLIFLGFGSCQKNGGGGTTCTPGPNNTHAFLTYTSLLSSSSGSTDVYRIELDKTQNSPINHLWNGQNGYTSESLVFNPFTLYFLSDSGGRVPQRVYSVNLDGTGLNKVFSLPYPILSINFTPGQTNLLVRYNSCMNCFVATPDSLGIFNILTGKFKLLGTVYYHADISKNGTKIYFDAQTSTGKPHIYSINTDGTNLTQITHSAYGEEYPALSPDGNTLAIASYMDAERREQEICLINIDGTNLRQITKLGSTSVSSQPCWSPAQDQIFFTRWDRSSNTIPSHIYSSNLDGSNIQQFTAGNGETYPSVGYLSQ